MTEILWDVHPLALETMRPRPESEPFGPTTLQFDAPFRIMAPGIPVP